MASFGVIFVLLLIPESAVWAAETVPARSCSIVVPSFGVIFFPPAQFFRRKRQEHRKDESAAYAALSKSLLSPASPLAITDFDYTDAVSKMRRLPKKSPTIFCLFIADETFPAAEEARQTRRPPIETFS
jgi:hypothetical protein